MVTYTKCRYGTRSTYRVLYTTRNAFLTSIGTHRKKNSDYNFLRLAFLFPYALDPSMWVKSFSLPLLFFFALRSFMGIVSGYPFSSREVSIVDEEDAIFRGGESGFGHFCYIIHVYLHHRACLGYVGLNYGGMLSFT